MFGNFRICFTLFVALVFALTSGSFLTGRGHMVIAGQMVICTGQGMKVVFTGRENQPVSPPVWCPECMHCSADAAIVSVPSEALFRSVARGVIPPVSTTPRWAPGLATLRTRSPPPLVIFS